MSCTLLIKFSIPSVTLISFPILSQKEIKTASMNSKNQNLGGPKEKKNLKIDLILLHKVHNKKTHNRKVNLI